MDLEIITKKQIPYDITHVECNLKCYKLTYLQNRLTDFKNKLMVTKGEMWGKEIN